MSLGMQMLLKIILHNMPMVVIFFLNYMKYNMIFSWMSINTDLYFSMTFDVILMPHLSPIMWLVLYFLMYILLVMISIKLEFSNSVINLN